jgi:hypothetical protein
MSQSLSSAERRRGIIMRQMPVYSNPQCDEKGDTSDGHRTPLHYSPRRANVAISHHSSVSPSFFTLLQPASAPDECVSPTSPILPSQVEVPAHRTPLTSIPCPPNRTKMLARAVSDVNRRRHFPTPHATRSQIQATLLHRFLFSEIARRRSRTQRTNLLW